MGEPKRHGGRHKLLPSVPAGGFREKRKLCEYDVVQIFGALRCGVPSDQIAYEWGIRVETVRQIARGVTWKHLPRPEFPSSRKHLQDYHLDQLVRLLAEGMTVKEAAAHVGTTTATAYRGLRRLREQQGVTDEWQRGGRAAKPGDAGDGDRERDGGRSSAVRPGCDGDGAPAR